jgi:hypothetical protein
MELSPSWEAANCAAIQELPTILWKPKAHYRVQKSPPLVPVLSQISPIHIIPSYLSKIHFNIVRSPTSWSFQWSLSFWLSHQYPLCIPLLSPLVLQAIPIIILSIHLCLGLPSGLFPSGFSINILHAFLFSPHSCSKPSPSLSKNVSYKLYCWIFP